MRTDQKEIPAHELDTFLSGVPAEFDSWQLQLRNGSVATIRSVRRLGLRQSRASTELVWSIPFVDGAGRKASQMSPSAKRPAWVLEIEDGTIREEVYEHAFETLTFVRPMNDCGR